MLSQMRPFLISWNLTYRCNLYCAHCYLEASAEEGQGELSTREAMEAIDQIAELALGAMVVFSGGEPLMRTDIVPLASYAAQKGLIVVVGSNGTLLTPELAQSLKGAGVGGMGLSLDSLKEEVHDSFRGIQGAWQGAMKALEICHRLDLPFQIHTTLTQSNLEELEGLLGFASRCGAQGFNLFFVICTGRGHTLSDLSPEQYESALLFLAQSQSRYPHLLIRARCAPHAIPLLRHLPDVLRELSPGCLAATQYLRITPEGEVTPCPYLPLSGGNLGQMTLSQVWQGEVFTRLRQGALGGKCGYCEFASRCRGCRARAFAQRGDYLAEDGWCRYQPQGEKAEQAKPVWSEEARKRMERAPGFIRHRVMARIEDYAQRQGYAEITPQVLEEVRARFPFPQHLRPHPPPGQ